MTEPAPEPTLIGWVDPLTILETWPDAPEGDALDDVLLAAFEQCAAYAPAPPAPVPARYRLAQVMQARALWRSTVAGTGDVIGVDGMTVTVWPMDRTVKALLRPTRVPVIR